MKIEINLKIILILVLFLLINKIDVYAIFLIFIIIHEIVHALVGILLGFKPKVFKLNPLGVLIEFYSYNNASYIKKILIFLAGPISNILLSLIFYFIDIEFELKTKLIYTNLLIGIFNLIPIIPLDGGRIFKEILTNFIGNKNANEFMIISTKVILAIITLIYSIVIFKMKNIAIFLLIIYLWYLYLIEEKKVKMVSKVYDALSKNLI
ncbi:MAG: hypothetical protein HFJ46_02740 [Clostridia bacterium]|nr:hypothetical protein [Clostridia bacterium]